MCTSRGGAHAPGVHTYLPAPDSRSARRVCLQLGYRLAHVLRRLLPVAMFLLQRDGQCLNGHDLFLKRVGACYHAFIDEVERGCKVRAWREAWVRAEQQCMVACLERKEGG